jgi:rhodanese-related sulfurtransferase/glyoxylase-like metal-dependent hydrolase (beta-lactamase superfamily II)
MVKYFPDGPEGSVRPQEFPMSRLPIVRPALVALAILAGTTALPASAQDAERATHEADASVPQVSFEEKGPAGDWIVRQYQLGCLSQLTYLVGSGGEAAIVDPQRDVDHYLRDAKALGLEIRHVVLTHTNADFVAGHTELARRAGAKVHISADSGSLFAHEGRRDGDRVRVGALTLEFLATPGHTLDSMSIAIHAPGAGADPAFVLTGDALFIGGIGRPDLVGGDVTPMVLADRAFDSMARLTALPDATKVLPAHGAGSLCGAHLSPETASTIGREKATNPYLRIRSRAQFVAKVSSNLPMAPQYFRWNVEMNRKGPPVVERTDVPPTPLEPAAVKAAADSGAWLVDLRDAQEYAAAHVAGSVNVALRGRLDTWTGTVVPFGARIVLVGSDAETREAAFRLRRIGYDAVEGALKGGVDAWKAAGLPVRTSRLVTPKELAAQMAAGTEPVIVDVRTHAEFDELRIGDYANIPVTDSAQFAHVLDRAKPVVMVCNSAYRSSMAIGLAERLGFADVQSLDGGMDAWITAGLPVTGTAQSQVCPAPVAAAAAAAAPVVPAEAVNLPERIEPRALMDGLLDQPEAWAVFDVRPAWQFAEYHVPGAANVQAGALVAWVRAQPAGRRVVIADRDGTQAWAVAGWLVAKLGDPSRSVRVLTGGTARFWSEIESVRPAAGAAPGAAPVAPAPQPAPTPAEPPKAPKKRSAGC